MSRSGKVDRGGLQHQDLLAFALVGFRIVIGVVFDLDAAAGNPHHVGHQHFQGRDLDAELAGYS